MSQQAGIGPGRLVHLVAAGTCDDRTDAPDPFQQARHAARDLLSRLRSCGAAPGDLIKLIVFHAPTGPSDRHRLIADLGAALGPDAGPLALTVQPLRALSTPGCHVVLEAYALRGHEAGRDAGHPPRRVAIPGALPPIGPPFCHGVRAGNLAFVSGQLPLDGDGRPDLSGDLVAHNARVLEQIATVLSDLGLDPADLVKVNTWRAPPPTPEGYHAAARARFDFLRAAGPAVTGISVPGPLPGDALIQIDGWAIAPVIAPDEARGGGSRQALRPPGHWDWSIPTPYSQGLRVGDWLFVGGQAALGPGGEVLAPDRMREQVEITVDYVLAVLAQAAGAGTDIVQMGIYYRHDLAEEALATLDPLLVERLGESSHRHTLVPVDALAYPGQVVEIEAIARIRR